MISVSEALKIVDSRELAFKSEKVSIDLALGRVVSATVYADHNFPPFRQSAMDGYALIGMDDTGVYDCVATVQAGDDATEIKLDKHHAVRIFTGAMVPKDADRVVRQEDVVRVGDTIQINVMPSKGANIRNEGEQVLLADILVDVNQNLTAGVIGYLTMLGIKEVEVFSLPEVAILVTGNELISVGETLSPGKVFESNSHLLRSLLMKYGIRAQVYFAKDEFEDTKKQISNLLTTYDLLIVSGGISVGDYDFVYKSLVENGVNSLFYKVKQKPGKPLFFGEKGEVFIFGLPGNPGAAHTCFTIYIEPLLKRMLRYPLTYNQRLPLSHSISKQKGLTHFLKAKEENGLVKILDGQSSAMLKSFVEANCLAIFPENFEHLSENEQIEVIRI